nr:protein BHLHb9-like [Loxodonta africana]
MAEAEREATDIVKAKAGFETDAVAERKGVSEAKLATETKARALSEPTALVKGVAEAMPRSWARNRPKDRSEVTIWPNAPAEIPASLASGYQVPSRTRPFSYTAHSSAEKNTGSLPAAEAGLREGIFVCLQSIDAYPFDSETCTRAIEKIRGQIRIRELNGIGPFPCSCKMECRLNSENFEKLVSLLKSDADPVIHKIAQIAMGVIKVHPLAQQLINEMGVLTVIESLLHFQFPDMTRKAEITLNPISAEERQRRSILHVVHMCKETVSFPLSSPGQQSGLKELGQLSADPDHHVIVAAYLPELSRMLCLGNHKTRNLVLKVLLNMSENPLGATNMMTVQVLSALRFTCHPREAKAHLITVVAIFVNIKEHIRRGSVVVVNRVMYNEFRVIFREVKMIIEKL